jgi:hypothetical protein
MFMDQIMWMLSLIPDAWLTMAVHAMTLTGLAAVLAGSLLRRIPIIDQYATLARVLGTVLLVTGVYFEGGMSNERAWRARVADMEAKVKAAEIKSEQANAQIETRVVEKTKVVREKAKIQIEYVNRLVKGDTVEIIKDMSETERAAFLAKQKELQDAIKNCPVPRIIIEEHNRATENK